MSIVGISVMFEDGVIYYLDFKHGKVLNPDGSTSSKITFHICDILDDLIEETETNKIIKFVYTPYYKLKLYIDKNRND